MNKLLIVKIVYTLIVFGLEAAFLVDALTHYSAVFNLIFIFVFSQGMWLFGLGVLELIAEFINKRC